jgi:hypothetical protein
VRRDARRVLHIVVDDPAVISDFDTKEELARARAPRRERDDRRGSGPAPGCQP